MLVQEPRIAAITAPTRRPLADAQGNSQSARSAIADALAQVVDPVDIVFCCLGTTLREAGSKEAFIHADYTLVVDTARLASSGREAYAGGQRDGSRCAFDVLHNRVKGEMEQALRAQAWPRLTFCPSLHAAWGSSEEAGQ